MNASKEVGLEVEPRADSLWRMEHGLRDLRSEVVAAWCFDIPAEAVKIVTWEQIADA